MKGRREAARGKRRDESLYICSRMRSGINDISHSQLVSPAFISTNAAIELPLASGLQPRCARNASGCPSLAPLAILAVRPRSRHGREDVPARIYYHHRYTSTSFPTSKQARHQPVASTTRIEMPMRAVMRTRHPSGLPLYCISRVCLTLSRIQRRYHCRIMSLPVSHAVVACSLTFVTAFRPNLGDIFR